MFEILISLFAFVFVAVVLGLFQKLKSIKINIDFTEENSTLPRK
jgi:hypothetical protein